MCHSMVLSQTIWSSLLNEISVSQTKLYPIKNLNEELIGKIDIKKKKNQCYKFKIVRN